MMDAAPGTATGPSGEPPRPGSGAMFDRIAHRYDLLNRVLSMGLDQSWRRRLVAAVESRETTPQMLDLATGTADVALSLARAYKSAQIVGSDPSEGMLEVGRQKVRELGLEARVRLESGDAQQLSYEDGAFDGVTMAFGIRNVPDRMAALREMCRVTRPGARVCILELGEPGNPLARFHVHHVVPLLGAFLSGAREYRYLQSSIAAFPPPDAFVQLMAEAGLEDARFEVMFMGVAHLYVGTSRGSRPR